MGCGLTAQTANQADNAEPDNSRGVVNNAKGEYENAKKAIENSAKVLQINPNHAKARNSLEVLRSVGL
jgi:hypothetical protein